MRKLINTITCLCVIAACGTAFAQKGEKMMSGPYKGPVGPMSAAAPDAPDAIFFTNLVANPCMVGQKYDTSNGFLVLGPTNCFLAGSTQWLAAPFIAKGTGAVTKVSLAITLDVAGLGCTPTSNKFTVQIYDDGSPNCQGVPGNPLGTPIVATAPAAPPALAAANFGATGPLLAAGNQVLGGSHDLRRSVPDGDNRSMVGGHWCQRALQLERWERLEPWPSRRRGRFPSPITSDTDQTLNRARVDILRELVLFCAITGDVPSQTKPLRN